MLFVQIGFGQKAPAALRFQRLSIEQGLSNNEINALLQDAAGLIWIGTAQGLDRYEPGAAPTSGSASGAAPVDAHCGTSGRQR